MGGNALTIETRRVDCHEYAIIQDRIIKYLAFRLGYQDVRPIPHVYDKASFGDLDLLVSKPKSKNLRESLQKDLGSIETIKNGDIISFEYCRFQVDLIHCSRENIDMAQVYFSYNDLGMLMGMLAKRANCKYGYDGLSYVHYSPNKERKWVIPLSKNPVEIFDFLNLDYSQFLEGFDSIESVFEFVMTSRWFDTQAYLDCEEWNHRRRKRNQKRANWQYFRDYIASRPYVSNPKPIDPLNTINKFFPDVDIFDRILEIAKAERRRKTVRKKFNGEIVRQLTGLEGKELGQFIARFKEQFEDFDRFVLYNSQTVINQKIQHTWQGFSD